MKDERGQFRKKFSFVVDVYHNQPDDEVRYLKDYVESNIDGVSEKGFGMDHIMFIRKKVVAQAVRSACKGFIDACYWTILRRK
jgi:hypothetical protein